MPPCKHLTLEFVGNQKTDDGVNTYYRCTACSTLLIMTPSRQVYGIPGVEKDQPSTGKKSPVS